jgi:hypothetical protein
MAGRFMIKKNKRIVCIKANRRTMDFIRHMRRSAFFPGRPGGLITEYLEIGEIRGNMRVGLSDEGQKTLVLIFTFFQMLFLSFPKSGRFVPSARKTENFCRYKK